MKIKLHTSCAAATLLNDKKWISKVPHQDPFYCIFCSVKIHFGGKMLQLHSVCRASSFFLVYATFKPTGIQRKQWVLIIHLETYLSLQRWSKGLLRAIMRSAVGKQSKHSQDHYSQVRLRLGSSAAPSLLSKYPEMFIQPTDIQSSNASQYEAAAARGRYAAVNKHVSHVICGRPAGRALSHSGWIVSGGGGGG